MTYRTPTERAKAYSEKYDPEALRATGRSIVRAAYEAGFLQGHYVANLRKASYCHWVPDGALHAFVTECGNAVEFNSETDDSVFRFCIFCGCKMGD